MNSLASKMSTKTHSNMKIPMVLSQIWELQPNIITLLSQNSKPTINQITLLRCRRCQMVLTMTFLQLTWMANLKFYSRQLHPSLKWTWYNDSMNKGNTISSKKQTKIRTDHNRMHRTNQRNSSQEFLWKLLSPTYNSYLHPGITNTVVPMSHSYLRAYLHIKNSPSL